MLFRVIVFSMGLMLGSMAFAPQLITTKGLAATNTALGFTKPVILISGKLQGLPPGPIETFKPGARATVRKGFSLPSLAPGVYKTSPFACIVVVPANQAEDQICVQAPGDLPAMPIIKPELNFTPLHSK